MKEKDNGKDAPPKNGMSRRKFLKGVGVGGGVLGTGILSGTLVQEGSAAADTSTKVLGPQAVLVEFTVNGERRSARLQPRVTLLEALRDHMDLTGAKRVCDRGSCGACTVILDGSAVYSCSVLVIEAQGKAIQTVEGLATASGLHPIQAAFVENDAQQCGFCTSGFVMAIKAMLDKHPSPTPEQIRMGIGGNLCRCGTYAGMRKAIAQASAQGPKNGGAQPNQGGRALRGGSNA